MNTTRRYTMRARAAAVEQTRRSIQRAVVDLAEDRLLADISLEAVARLAGVSVQTVLRQFGSRAGLLEGSMEEAVRRVTDERRSPPGDVDSALRTLVDHYERRGDSAVLRLAEERTDTLVATIVERGRRLHRDWVVEVFAPFLAAVPDRQREHHVDLLVVATDVYTWKLLRRDRGLSRTETEARMRALVSTLLTALPAREDS